MLMKTKLSKLRESQNLTLAETARRLNLPQTSYYRYETGERFPRINVGIKIADFFGVKNIRELWLPNSVNAS